MIHHRNRNLAIMQLVLTELERKVREEISIKVAVDEFGVNHKPTIQESLQWDANTVMEQIHMAESRHMQMGALCSYLLQYPDMTIRDFFAMASEEIREQEEELGYYE